MYNVNPETDTTGDASVDATNEAADAPDVANEKDVEKSEENIENTENENQVKEETSTWPNNDFWGLNKKWNNVQFKEWYLSLHKLIKIFM